MLPPDVETFNRYLVTSHNSKIEAQLLLLIVGQVVRSRRTLLGIGLATMARKLGLTTSGWSRVETAATTMTVVQLRNAARALSTTPSDILRSADSLAAELESSGIAVV